MGQHVARVLSYPQCTRTTWCNGCTGLELPTVHQDNVVQRGATWCNGCFRVQLRTVYGKVSFDQNRQNKLPFLTVQYDSKLKCASAHRSAHEYP
jgi:hypothetical protein